MNSRNVEFRNERGESLRGDLYLPLQPPRAYVIFAHCFTCAANWKAPVRIARALCRENYAVLAFDFTGLGRSGGEFADTNFSTNIGDLVAAARWLESAEGEGPALLVGHSLGGAAVLAAASDIDSVKAIVTIGAPSRASHVANLLDAAAREEIERNGEARIDIGGRPFTIRKQLLDELERHDVPQNLKRLRRALLVMHSPADDIVSIDEASEIFLQALHPKSFVSLDDSDHLLSREQDAEYAGAVAAAWASRYLDGERRAEATAAADGAVVARTGPTGFATEIDAAGHALLADEPVSLGGSDLGPTPYGLLSAALASCTSVTLQMYARHKGLALDTAAVSVRHSRVHARDCESCETREGRIHKFDRELILTGELDAAARRRLAEIADRCPVHKALKGDVLIETVLADAK